MARFSVCPPRLEYLSQDAFILFDRINGFIASQVFRLQSIITENESFIHGKDYAVK